MEQEKQTYYVDMNSESILREPLDSPSFVIHATEQEVKVLRSIFEDKYGAELETFVRAHIPYLEYHIDPGNDHFDASQKIIYAILHQLGNKEAKQHIEQMGILSDRKSDDPEEIEHFR